jgi:hypothetical protein
MDLIDDVLNGTTPVTGIDINSGTIDNVVVGGTTAVAGTFTVLTANTSLGVTGNITVSGTVDGRDVAADGTKLDGVESGATADQTKADIDALGIAATTASTLATARNIAVTGAVTGNANFDGSGNISIATTATADPTLTLNGDASGSATFTNLGNATLTVTVADDSHNHVISNVDGLQTALDGKLSTSGKAADSNLLDGYNSSQSESSNTVAVRNASGYLFSNYFNGSGTFSTTGNTSGMARFTGTNGSDTYGRSYTAAAAAALLSGQTMNISGTATNITQYTVNQSVGSGNSPTFAEVYNNGWFRNNQAGEGLYNQATGAHWYSPSQTQWFTQNSGSSQEIQLQTNGATRRGSLYANSSNEIGLLDSDNHWAIKHVRDSRTEFLINNSEYMELNTSGLYLHDGSLREDYDALSGTSPTCNVNNGGTTWYGVQSIDAAA